MNRLAAGGRRLAAGTVGNGYGYGYGNGNGNEDKT
jgi:hypothetical protein